jgi:hypothetical protein
VIDRPSTARSRRRVFYVARLVAAGAVVVAGVVVIAVRHTSTDLLPDHPSAAQIRNVEIERVLAVRGSAVLHHNRKAFMSTLDPQGAAFRRSQGRMFADLPAADFSSWSYSMTRTARRSPPDVARYRDPVWAPRDFTLNYRLAHFDTRPTNLRQYPTFVERHGRWYLASLSDYAPSGLVSATDLWDYGPVSVVRRSDVLVLGSPVQRETMLDVASDVQAAIPQVTSVWGNGWARRAVVLLPRTTHDMALIDSDHEDLRNIAALTSAEIDDTAGHPAPVGDRVTINPINWPKLSDLGQQVVLRHELTHVASEAATGAQTPTWLIEGLADYVGFKFADVPVAAAAVELQDAIEAGHLPARLPSDRGFRGADKSLAVHYEEAWFVCRTIAQRFGEATLVRFYRTVGTSSRSSAVAVRDAVMRVLHLRVARLVSLWRADIQTELA